MNKHFAIDPNGNVHTRNSKTRVYSHTVVARLNREEADKQTLRVAEDAARTNYEFYCGRKGTAYTNWKGEPDTCYVHDKEYHSAAEFIADYPSVEDAVAYEVGKAQAKIDARTDSYYDDFFNLGWNGRRDLAEKLASKEARRTYRDITILEATIK